MRLVLALTIALPVLLLLLLSHLSHFADVSAFMRSSLIAATRLVQLSAAHSSLPAATLQHRILAAANMSTSASAPASSSLTSTIRSTILAAFAADSLSLGAHWEYNTDTIATTFKGKVDRLHGPISSYHPNKVAGDQTHIGDNAILLLESIAAAPKPAAFTVQQYIDYWRGKWDVPTPPAYLDHATKETLKGLKEGKTGREAASTDDDLSHSARFFPLLAILHADEDQLAATARQLTSSFQQGDNEAATSEWLARVTYRVVVNRQKPSAAIDAVTRQLGQPFLTDAVQKGRASVAQSDVDALRSFGEKKVMGERTFYSGLSCGVKFGVPAVVHYALKYEDAADPTAALIEDVSVGGNSNARVMSTALLLFGYRGTEGFKVRELIAGLRQREHIESLLDTIEAAQK